MNYKHIEFLSQMSVKLKDLNTIYSEFNSSDRATIINNFFPFINFGEMNTFFTAENDKPAILNNNTMINRDKTLQQNEIIEDKSVLLENLTRNERVLLVFADISKYDTSVAVRSKEVFARLIEIEEKFSKDKQPSSKLNNFTAALHYMKIQQKDLISGDTIGFYKLTDKGLSHAKEVKSKLSNNIFS